MFDGLSGRLGDVLDKLRRRGSLSEADVDAAMREVRVALLEADVALAVVKQFVAQVKEQAIGQEVIRSVTPGQMVVKLVHDALVDMLSGEGGVEAEPDPMSLGIDIAHTPPVPILMVGLQGSGKTTTSAKIALRITKRERKKVLMASLDVYRPAAQRQLAILGEQTGVDTLEVVMGQKPVEIARRAMQAARVGGYDVVILDTAGRLHIDEVLMTEVAEVRALVNPHEVLLVTDAMTGQDAVNVAQEFNEKVGVTGIVLTRVDGDSRGGAALSMRAVTGVPIKLMGMGEKMDALEAFHAQRIAGRILGMGDVVALVEKAAETIEMDQAERVAKRMMEGKFDLEDMLAQIRQIKKMGDMKGLLGMMPGISKMQRQMAESKIDDNMMKRQEAIILSMTIKERRNPDLVKASRKKRIADGSGSNVPEVNKLLKQHQQMAVVMKKMKKMGGKKGLMGLLGGMGGGGEGDAPDLSALGGAGGGLPPGFPGLGGPRGGLPPGFPGRFSGKKK
ncbi:signal recognition particle protein [Rhodospirillum rubrum]|uniref:Signal recognition particle protein n=1 Tax=Rhodospirillum rubrum (strain ATCC 11170 / ATH 1.1.1 / DSM 467 / LMG 4362 / NCIMB 8255 / S1) TaxID=269796 RepID=Q2RV60_RHORT|nr:signal recognition particle protein [Rhodospirillum rubrum]ABC21985.1 signal recognition particle subunit FFH/SRP54 (srp54) [Rhodospirillum rubrum ATCC 11170]AEO47697.1 signal recognition particle subunit FFH/SRP54 (srp54) [Rhodospirillum rubrum F11]MBK5953566.1 signal recognition particle protein [Rhodospirillum rubrum]QXG81641.1 signal recognition particle protein [Rhodospirillum rubrum]HAP99140.1 signal recognition particle protein [Rhodospirillum rubrum]